MLSLDMGGGCLSDLSSYCEDQWDEHHGFLYTCT